MLKLTFLEIKIVKLKNQKKTLEKFHKNQNKVKIYFNKKFCNTLVNSSIRVLNKSRKVA